MPNMGKSSRLQKPIKRNNTCFDLCVFCIFALCFAFYAKDFSHSDFFLFNGLSAIVVSAVVILKWFYFVREALMWRHTHASFTDLIIKCVKMKNWQSFLLAECVHLGCIVFGMYFSTSKTEDLLGENLTLKNEILKIVTYILFNIFLLMYFQWHESPITESYRLEQSHSFSGGSNMAFGFFYGYLRLILPGKEGFLKKINDFQDRNEIDASKIPFKKLFILIPSSTFIYDHLRKIGTELLEPLEDRLDVHKQDRGMVENRVYKNTVYKLKKKSNSDVVECYIPLEGAAPLKTFWETCNGESRFKEFKREIISSFYYTLDELIKKDRETRGLVELVYYNDENNELLDEELLAKVVRKRIKHLKEAKKLR